MIEKEHSPTMQRKRHYERYPHLDFMAACSQVVRGRTISNKLKRKEKRTKRKTYKSWLGPTFIVKGNYVLTVY